MRVGVISDIHGNLVCLEAILSELRQAHVEQVVCLGDVAELGPRPHDVIRELRQLRCAVVMGNEDEALLSTESPRKYADEGDEKIHEIDKWTVSQMTSSDLDFIRNFEPTVRVDLPGGKALLCCHGSPRSNTERITSTAPDDEELEKIISGARRPFALASGHTHLQMTRSHLGSTILFNPGSVGLPFLYHSVADLRVQHPKFAPQAEWALLETDGSSTRVELRRTRVGFDKISASIMDSGMPHAEWLMSQWEPS
ncbi:MAG: metallophosphoesterase family protein [Nitrososphaerota archaeon]|nr:metallophosphoesterase family protein [Nitrososphaerota archaeon]